MIYHIAPVPKPRMTQRDKWAKRPAVMSYRAFKDEIRAAGVTLPCPLTVHFRIAMAASWSAPKRKKYVDTPHLYKPDLDNLIKALLDSVLAEDSHIWQITASKTWADKGSIEIT